MIILGKMVGMGVTPVHQEIRCQGDGEERGRYWRLLNWELWRGEVSDYFIFGFVLEC